jgi:hypothetical protein
MILSLNDATRVVGDPSGVTGWTLVDSVTSGTMRTLAYSRTAQAGDAGRTVRFSMDAAAKYTLTVAAYSGDTLEPRMARTAETTVRTAHTTPVLDAAAGDWVVSYWADKSSATTAFALPSTVTSRQTSCGANAGHVCSVLADSAGPVPGGTYAGVTATADAASGAATMWTIVLPQAS